MLGRERYGEEKDQLRIQSKAHHVSDMMEAV